MTVTEDNDENRKGHSYPEAPQLDASSWLLLVPSPCVQKLAESSQLLASRKMPKSHLPPPGSAGSGLDPGWCLFWKHSTGALVLWHLNSSLASTELLESKPDGEWAGRSSPREHSFPASHLASVLTKRKSNSCVSEYAHFKKKKSPEENRALPVALGLFEAAVEQQVSCPIVSEVLEPVAKTRSRRRLCKRC